jgi:ribose transport system permease protein
MAAGHRLMAESKTTTIGHHGRSVLSVTQFLGSGARQRLLAFTSLIILVVYFALASPAFMQIDNIIGILQSTAVNGVLAIASTFVIITAGIDLSVGCLMTFCAVTAGVFLSYWHLPVWTGVLAAIGMCALSGTISGTLVAKLKIPPFIATLGMMLVDKGLSLVVSADKGSSENKHTIWGLCR